MNENKHKLLCQYSLSHVLTSLVFLFFCLWNTIRDIIREQIYVSTKNKKIKKIDTAHFVRLDGDLPFFMSTSSLKTRTYLLYSKLYKNRPTITVSLRYNKINSVHRYVMKLVKSCVFHTFDSILLYVRKLKEVPWWNGNYSFINCMFTAYIQVL